jgi:hydroxymethylbilane synthase
LSQIGGQGVFTAKLCRELEKGHVDFVVHSLKDLPTANDEALILGAIPPREDPRDVLVSRCSLKELLPQSRIGTGSLRRQIQIKKLRADLKIVDIRGNIDSRLQQVVEGKLDAILLAGAGLKRLQKDRDIKEEILERNHLKLFPFETDIMIPAVAQGALGIQCRKNDRETRKLLESTHDAESARAVFLERQLLALLGGGCQVPFAAFAEKEHCSFFLACPETGKSVWRKSSFEKAPLEMKRVIENEKSWIKKLFRI